MKKIKSLIKIIILLIIIFICYVIYDGYKMYKSAIETTSIEQKINSIKSKENYCTLDEMPQLYKEAVVAVEDHRFYRHGAFDFISIGRAICVNIKSFQLKEGGSTITQQLAKNAYFTQKKELKRKIAEFFMAVEFEKNCSKDEILELYLNTSYFGDGYYCVAEASRGYYKKEPKDMNRNEASMLAGIPNAPSAYCPTKHLDLAKKRQNQVLDKMVRYEFITAEEKEEILNESNAVEDNKD